MKKIFKKFLFVLLFLIVSSCKNTNNSVTDKINNLQTPYVIFDIHVGDMTTPSDNNYVAIKRKDNSMIIIKSRDNVLLRSMIAHYRIGDTVKNNTLYSDTILVKDSEDSEDSEYETINEDF